MKGSLAVIGGGFSGAMTLVQLVKQAEAPLMIHWIEPSRPGGGIAYGTHDPEHLLNVRADRMGAMAGDPGHFWRWAESPEATEARRLLRDDQALSPESFAPRRFYAAYVRSLWQEALIEAKRKRIDVTLHQASVTAIESPATSVRLVLDDGQSFETAAAILAIGNLEASQRTRRFPGLPDDSPLILPSAWEAEGEAALMEAVQHLGASGTIFILGTGLTTVDTVLTLERLGYEGSIVALSRNGKLPLPHAAQGNRHWPEPPTRLLPLLQALRTNEGGDWRATVDALRPHAVRLWQGFSPKEKAAFLRRLFTLWNIHRHRMAPQIHARMEALQNTGRLRVIAGRLQRAEMYDGRIRIDYTKAGISCTVTADRAIACIGPGYDVERNPHPLLARLLADGMVQPHALKSGLAAQGYCLEGEAKGKLLGIGTVLIGERLETTAVPELREQTAEVAALALARVAKEST